MRNFEAIVFLLALGFYGQWTQAQEPANQPLQLPPQEVESERVVEGSEKADSDSPAPTKTEPNQQENQDAKKTAAASEKPQDEDKLYFSFAGSRWSDVLKWLADSSGLALHVSDLPPGSFTYSDDQGFTIQQAIDRINLFLLPEGYTLVKSNRLLSVINLTDPISLKQLDTLARLVTVKELESLEDHDMVKCLFPLGELSAEEAVEELTALGLLTTPDVFSRTNQLLITDTAGKLKIAHKIISAFAPDTLDNGTIIKSFELNHVSAEDVLSVARPHLGLATGEMIGIDVSISADVLGKNIFVTGIEDKVKLIEGLIKEIDVAEKKSKNANDILQAHRVTGGNVEMVYNVLQTMLSGEEIRLSMDKTAQSIVALAPEETQKLIADTVLQLQASEAEFAVITLQHVDPYFVISLLEEMLDLDDTSLDSEIGGGFDSRRRGWGGWGGFDRGQQNAVSVDPPKIDADPGSRKLFVLGNRYQIEQIKAIVADLDVATSSTTSSESTIRIIPLRGPKAVEAIKTAARFWQGKNSIIFYPGSQAKKPQVLERVIADEQEPQSQKSQSQKQQTQDDQSLDELGPGILLTPKVNSEDPEIKIQVTPRGILIQCEYVKALSSFEEIIRTVIGPTDSTVSAPVIYYLKYAKPDEAIRMLAELLDGGDAAKEAESGTLVNGIVSNAADTFWGSLIMSRDGTLTMTYGTVTVVADTRLNRLIAQGTAEEMEQIETYLKIIDKDKSITAIEIYGSSHVIELEHVDANEVAATIRDAYFGRVMGNASTTQSRQPANRSGGQAPQPRDPRQQNNQSRDNNERGQNREGNQRAPQPKPANGGTRNNEPKMTIAVHESSNSLIVTAPDALFKEVEKLAKLIDSRGVQAVEVIQIRRPLANDLQQILMGQSSNINSSRSNSSNTNRSSSSRSNNGNSNSRSSRPRGR